MNHAALLTLALAISPATTSSRAPADAAFVVELGPKVDRLVELLRDGSATEDARARTITLVHLKEEDGELVAPIAVVFLSIEAFHGGNGHTEYLAAFSRTTPPGAGTAQVSLLGVIPVGGKGLRTLKFKEARVEPRDAGFEFVVPTLRYGKSDAKCCPSVASEARFRVTAAAGGALTEVVRRR